MSKEDTHLMDLQDEIERMFEEGDKIDKRKKKVYQEWKNNINTMITLYNKKCNFNAYSKVK